MSELPDFTLEELYLIGTSLEFTVRAFEDCDSYPTYEFKRARIAEARAVLDKVRAQIREVKKCNPTK